MSKYKNLFPMLAAVLFLTAMASQAFAADVIKLGVAGAHSGDLASYGLPTLKAAQLVVKDINAAGGINGKMIEIVSADDACKPAEK